MDQKKINDIAKRCGLTGSEPWMADLVGLVLESTQSPAPIPEQVAPSYWNPQRKMIERAIVGLRDGWATCEDADAALAVLGSSYAPTKEPAQEVPQQAAKAETDNRRHFCKPEVIEAWACVRKHNHSIPDAALDDMRDVLMASLDLAPTTSTVSPSGADGSAA